MTNRLEDVKINVKIKLSALWATVMFLYIYADHLSLFKPGLLEEIIAVETPLGSQISLLAAAILMTIPSIMIFLSLALKAKVNRGANIIVGIAYTSINLLMNLLLDLLSDDPSAFYIFFAIVEAGATALIVWYAWKWPKQEGSPE